MNRWIISAAVLSGVTFFIHVVLGGMDVHSPFLESSLSHGLKTIASIIWHTVSAIIFINTIALIISAWRVDLQLPLIWLVSAQYLALAVLFVFYGASRLGSILIMPQWTIFLAISGLALLGMRKESQSVHAS